MDPMQTGALSLFPAEEKTQHARFHNPEKPTCASAQAAKQEGLPSDIDTLLANGDVRGVFFFFVFLSVM